MRDIRPAPLPPRKLILPGGPATSKPPEPAPADLSSLQEPVYRPESVVNVPPTRLPGSAVPVKAVHVAPRIHSDADHKKEEKRPLFFTKPAKTPPPTRSVRVGYKERKILAVFVALIIVAAGLAVYLFLPQATIRLALKTAPLVVEQKLTIRAQNTAGADVIPGTAFFREIQVEGEADVISTEVIGSKATGTVQLVNRSAELQKIKENSRLVTAPGTLFYMQGSAFIPPNSRVAVQVEAAESGEGGNIDPQKLYFAALPESARALLYAEATQKLAGGAGEQVHVIKDTDLTEAQKTAAAQARARAEQEIRGELPAGWVILEESWATESAGFETPATVGDRTLKIPFKAKVTIRVLGYEKEKFENRLREALTARLDKDYMLFPGPVASKVTVESVDWSQAQGVLNVRVSHMTIPQLSVASLQDKLAGRPIEEARQYLEGLPSVHAVEVGLWPFWVQNIPRIQQRISVDLQSDQP